MNSVVGTTGMLKVIERMMVGTGRLDKNVASHCCGSIYGKYTYPAVGMSRICNGGDYFKLRWSFTIHTKNEYHCKGHEPVFTHTRNLPLSYTLVVIA